MSTIQQKNYEEQKKQYVSKLERVNGIWDKRISQALRDIQAFERHIGALGTPAPGKLAPALSIQGQKQYDTYRRQLDDLVRRLNADFKSWMRELVAVNKPPAHVMSVTKPFDPKKDIPYPNWMPQVMRDGVGKVIERGGIPLNDSFTIKNSGLNGIKLEFNKDF